MKKRISSIVFLFVCLLLLSLYGFDSKLQRQNKRKETLQHEVTVTLKLIQVYVTNKDGNPAMDLGIEDFEIYDNKKRMQLTEFEKYTLTLPSDEKKPDEPKVEPKPKEKTQPPEKMTRKFFLFFDFAFNNKPGIEKSKEAALHFIDTQLQQSDEVGIFSYSLLKRLTLHEYLTTEHKKIREVVEGFGVKEVLGRIENMEAGAWLGAQIFKPASQEARPRNYNPGLPSESGSAKRFDPGSPVFEQKLQISNFAAKIRDLAKALRYIPGQKHIVLFSSGVPSSILYGVGAPYGSMKASGRGDSVTLNHYENMIKELSSSNCPIYVLNSEELQSHVYLDEQIMGNRSLRNLATQTGGKYYEHVYDYAEINEEISTMTGSYYVLGYYIGEKWDGKYHKIKVKVKKKGCKVHAQGGYYNPKPFLKYSKLEKQLHLVDLALIERPLFQDPFHFPLEAIFSAGDEEYNLTLSLKIPSDKLSELSGKKVEIVSLIFDEKDNVVRLKREEMDLSRLPEEEFQHTSQLLIPPGSYKCRVVIRNLETGKSAVGAASVKIPK